KDARARALGDAFAPAQRARYVVAGFVIPLGLAVWAIVGLATRSAVALGWMIELMFFLVGWHYVKQGFGVMTVLAARRAVVFRPPERLALPAHCLAGWAHAWASRAHAGRESEEKGVVYTALGRPPWLGQLTGIALVLTLVALVVTLVQKRRR